MSDKQDTMVIVSTADQLAKALGRPPESPPKPEEKAVSKTFKMTVEGVSITYTMTAGTYRVTLDDKPPVDMFYIAYTVDGADRPVTFAFNGGPGSSSVWLHMGIFGPQRVEVDVDHPARNPGGAVDNPLTLLTTSDLVFIDPVSTGHSHTTKKEDGKPFHGVKGDIESVSALILRWTTEHKRWGSPKYLAGESYGTIRAAGVAHHLQERWGMHVNGLVLISVALKLGTLLFDEANNWLASVLLLPCASVTAHYHGKIDLEDFPGVHDVWALHAEVERFARTVYTPALMSGDRASEEERTALSVQLARYTGVSAAFWQRCDNHLDLGRFCMEVLRDEGRTVGRLDARFKGYARDRQVESLTSDPSFTAIMGTYTTALYMQLASLGYEEARAYRIFNPDVWPWTFDDCENKALDMGTSLREVMLDNTDLRVFVASGLYDMATPWSAAEYTLAQLQLPAVRRDAITSRVYEAGHMMYLHEPSAQALRADLETFYSGSPTT